jgi:hypothetical protein
MHSTGTAVADQVLSNTRQTNGLLHEDNQRALAGRTRAKAVAVIETTSDAN